MNGKNVLTMITIPAICLATVTVANAASTNTVYMSGTLVLVFLAFCALVVAIQLFPAMLLLIGMIKGALTHKEKKEAEARVQ